MINLALVGIGGWASNMAKQVNRSSRVNLYKVFTRTKKVREEFAQKFDSIPAESYEEILWDPDVKGIILEVPNFIHKEKIIAAAKHNKPVMVDKPISNNIKDAKEAIESCYKNNNILMVGHNSRKRPESRKIKKLIKENQIGKVVTVDSVFSTPKGNTLKPNEWRWFKDKCPGGPLLQIGIHHIDTLAYLLGPIIKVSGFQKHLHIKAEIVDTTVTILDFSSGCLGYINSCYNTVYTYEINLYGTKGKICYSDANGLWITDLQGNKKEIKLDYKNPVEESIFAEIEEFADCIKSGKKPEVGGKEGLNSLAVTIAAIMSYETGKTIDVEKLIQKS